MSEEPVKHLLKVFDAETGGDDWFGPPRLKSEKAIQDYGRQKFEEGWRARGEADTEKIRRDCGACGGTGWTEPPNHGPDDPYPGDECEYCGRPQLAIKDMVLPAAQPAQEKPQ